MEDFELKEELKKISESQSKIMATQNDMIEKMNRISSEYDAMSDRMTEVVDTVIIKVTDDVNHKFDHFFLEISKRQIDYEKINRIDHEDFKKDIDYLKRFSTFNYFVYKNAVWFISAIALLLLIIFILIKLNYEKINLIPRTNSFYTSGVINHDDEKLF